MLVCRFLLGQHFICFGAHQLSVHQEQDEIESAEGQMFRRMSILCFGL